METDDQPLFQRLVVVHDVKCNDDYFWMVERGIKPFELRLNDRDYHIGDYMLLREYNLEHDRFSGRTVMAIITCLVVGPWLAEDHVALGIEVLKSKVFT